MIVVSHDREFLDQICNKIVDIEDGSTITYKGNYSKFLGLRKDRLTQWRDKYEKQCKFLNEEESIIKKLKRTMNSDSNAIHLIRQKEASINKFRNSPNFLQPPPRERKFRFRFPTTERCRDVLMEIEHLEHGYPTRNTGSSNNLPTNRTESPVALRLDHPSDSLLPKATVHSSSYKPLFTDFDFDIKKHQKIGIIGPNGVGKTTLLKVLAGLEEPRKGTATITSSSVLMNYYSQNQADTLNLNQTVIESVQEVASEEVSFENIRNLLAQFLFKNDDIYKTVGSLSGGEKARVALCRMMMKPSNLLFLDEVRLCLSFFLWGFVFSFDKICFLIVYSYFYSLLLCEIKFLLH
jgi:ATP-binding cassette subfamily F protein 3